jgi:hypothetical protein
MTDVSDSLPDLIHELVEKFEETHGREPDAHEAKQIGTEAFLCLTVDQVFEAHKQMTAVVKWNEA